MSRGTSARGSWLETTGFALIFISFSVALTSPLWFNTELPPFFANPQVDRNPQSSSSSLFTNFFPAKRRFRDELEQLRRTGKLDRGNEVLINRMVVTTSDLLKMPPAILWCLMFQESRLNHLEGISKPRSALGLGQFTDASFFEVNHHLGRYTDDNLVAMKEILGRDVRPISPKKNAVDDPSSYFYIPTAVVSTAAYLNNRHLHLKSLLRQKNVQFSSNLLWFYSVMAYNKGSRSVLSLWNAAKQTRGKFFLETLVTDANSAFLQLGAPDNLKTSLRQIWSRSTADLMAQELNIHMRSLRDCAVTPRFARASKTNSGESF